MNRRQCSAKGPALHVNLPRTFVVDIIHSIDRLFNKRSWVHSGCWAVWTPQGRVGTKCLTILRHQRTSAHSMHRHVSALIVVQSPQRLLPSSSIKAVRSSIGAMGSRNGYCPGSHPFVSGIICVIFAQLWMLTSLWQRHLILHTLA